MTNNTKKSIETETHVELIDLDNNLIELFEGQ